MAVHFADQTPPRLPGRGRQVSAVALAAAGAAALAASFALDPARIDDGPVLCPFRLLTGLPCPGCGLTRSWVHLAHGQWGDAFAENAFGPLSMVAVLALVVIVVVRTVQRAPQPDVARWLSSRVFLAVGAVWIAYGVGRLLVDVAG